MKKIYPLRIRICDKITTSFFFDLSDIFIYLCFIKEIDEEFLKNRHQKLLPNLSERDQRLVVTSDAEMLGYGGTSLAAKLSGKARSTIIQGKKELNGEVSSSGSSKIRRAGGGRKKAIVKHQRLEAVLSAMIEPVTIGYPESVLRWTCISTRNLAEALTKKGYCVSDKVWLGS